MLDLKTMKSALEQLEEERGIPKEKIIEAIELALAAAYKKDYGKKGQIVKAVTDFDTGTTDFVQVKIVVDDSMVRIIEEEEETETRDNDRPQRGGFVREEVLTPLTASDEDSADGDSRVRYNSEHHIMIEDARLIKKDAQIGEELIFPLEAKDDYGRIAAQTAKQVIIQKIREAEKASVLDEFGKRGEEIVSGTVQRIERGNIFVDLGRATGIMMYEDQIPGERYRQGERIKAYLYSVEESPRGVNLRLSRAHPNFIRALFSLEAPEIASGVVEIKAVVREPGSRAKIAVYSSDEHIDPVGSCVGQRGVRVSTVMSELSGERLDIIEWYPEIEKFISESLSPAEIRKVTIHADDRRAEVDVLEKDLSQAIGRGGQNVRLAAKLTGWKIDIHAVGGDTLSAEETGSADIDTDAPESPESEIAEFIESEGGVPEVVEDDALQIEEATADNEAKKDNVNTAE